MMSLKESPSAYIIVLNWNGKEHLSDCFSSLAQLSYPNYRVIMVDNGSKDGSVEFVQRRFPDVKIVILRKNVGFAAGNNAGIRHALEQGAKYIALLNNDSAVHPSWISELVAAAEADPSIAVCASKMIYYHNRGIINGVGVAMNRLCCCWDKHNGKRIESVQQPEEVLAACGGAFFARAAALKQAGLLDPAYFIYLEDVDLCIRIRQLGYKILTVPSAIVFHKYSATMREGSAWKGYLTLKNRFRLLFKLCPREMISDGLPKILREERKRLRNYLQQREIKRAWTQLSALLITMAGLPRILYLRRMILRTPGTFPSPLIDPSYSPPKLPPPPAPAMNP